MSYSIHDARLEFISRIQEVMETRDVEGGYELARHFFEQGDDEQGEKFRKLAKTWDNEDWAHDNHIGN